jgi:hypothetical protein
VASLAFRIPIGVLEGVETSDHRIITPDALVARPLPLPLQSMRQNPEMGGHGLAVISGTVLSLDRVDASAMTDPVTGEPFGPGAWAWTATGEFSSSDDGEYFAERVADGSLRFISVDVAGAEVEIDVTEEDEDGYPVEWTETLTAGEIAGFTQTAHPAFYAATIELDGAEPGGVEVPAPTPVEAATGIRVLSDGPGCEPCTADPAVVVAGGGPLHPPAEWFTDPGYRPGDGRLVEQPDGSLAAPLTIGDDGRVSGHVAPWSSCHTGFPGQCLTPPHSATGYALFHTGAVRTADRQDLPVGQLTIGTGHAPVRGQTITAAMEHYDNTGSAFADVRCGEDQYGIWVAGAVRPDVTDVQLRAARGARLSGDWRRVGTGMELIAALAVNVPGYPIVRARALAASGVPQALVAASVVRGEPPSSSARVLAQVDAALRPLYAAAARDALTRIGAGRG